MAFHTNIRQVFTPARPFSSRSPYRIVFRHFVDWEGFYLQLMRMFQKAPVVLVRIGLELNAVTARLVRATLFVLRCLNTRDLVVRSLN